MEQIIHKYRKAAFLSYQTIVHLNHFLLTDDTRLIFLSIKHIKDPDYRSTIIPIPTSVDFETAFQKAIFSVCEQIHPDFHCTQPPIIRKTKVSFSDTVHVRLIGEEQIDYTVQLV